MLFGNCNLFKAPTHNYTNQKEQKTLSYRNSLEFTKVDVSAK